MIIGLLSTKLVMLPQYTPPEVLIDFVEGYLTIVVPLYYLIFLHQLENWLTSSGQLGNKSRNVVKSSQKASNFLLSARSWNFLYCFNFGRINLDAFVADNET